MNFRKSDLIYLPVKDFAENSPFFDRLGWSHRMIIALIRSRALLDGKYCSNYGGWQTNKAALYRAICARNKCGLAPPVELELAYQLISPVPIPNLADR